MIKRLFPDAGNHRIQKFDSSGAFRPLLCRPSRPRRRCPAARLIRLTALTALLALFPFAVVSSESQPASPPLGSEATPLAWNQIGAAAETQYQGDGPAIVTTSEGALLRCVFQRLEGEATAEGLWLSSTVPNAAPDRFRVVAKSLSRKPSNLEVFVHGGHCAGDHQRDLG